MALFFPGAPRRKDGEVTPRIKLGIFDIRIPGWHWGFEPTEIFQAMVMFVTGMGAIAVLQEVFGISFELALTIVVFHELTYCLHQIMGDPMISGWITPALPLVTTFLLTFEMGTDRIHALIALQLSVGVIFLILGLTGMAKKLLSIVPLALQSGIILGAGIAALIGTRGFLPTGAGFFKYPFSVGIGGTIALFLLFSKLFSDRVHKNKQLGKKDVFTVFANYGMVPGLVVGIIAGWITGEIPLPVFQGGIIFKPHFGEVFSNFSLFNIGLPPAEIWLAALPMALVAYIIAFGDMVLGATVIDQAQQQYRNDENINFNPNRLHILCAVRNFLEGSLFPTVTLAGPIWAAMTVAVTERYKLGRKAMDSIFGGSGSFNLMKVTSCVILPLVYIFQEALPVALALTMLIQAFACGYVAMLMINTNAERGLALTIGGILAVAGATWGLILGIVLCLIILGPKSFSPRSDALLKVMEEK